MKHAFLGTNSGVGFVGHFGEVVGDDGSYRLVILKGGSGTGKSTLMNKAAEFCRTMQIDGECYPCSSDPASLDGVYFNKLKTAIIDGTAPHTVDPKSYGAHGVIVNMGDAVSESSREKYGEIKDILAEKSARYSTAYAYLGACRQLMKNADSRFAATGFKKADRVAAKLVKCFDAAGDKGLVRRMFLSAFTPKGFVCLADGWNAKSEVVLTGGSMSVYSEILGSLAARAGGDVNIFMDPLCPEYIAGIYLYNCAALVTAESAFLGTSEIAETVDAGVRADKSAAAVLKQGADECVMLANFASEQMKEAYELHCRLEELYRPYVDFEKVNGKIDSVITLLQG